MTDMLNRKIRKGDLVLRIWTASGSIYRDFEPVIGFTNKMIRVFRGRTVSPGRCIIVNHLWNSNELDRYDIEKREECLRELTRHNILPNLDDPELDEAVEE